MKPNRNGMTVTGSLPGERREMGFDARAMEHIGSILRNMYSDLELAVIRELSTNARDSHVQAGHPERPIEVSTPGPLSPYLTVKDTGLGLSVEELFELFGTYGASTKRDTNDATGMLGIGSKSPLSYTSQFTLVAIHNGTRATVSVSLDERNVGQLTVVDTAATDEPNGVEVRVPAKSSNDFDRKAKAFFRYWPKGTVLLNGKEPSTVDGLRVTDSITLCRGGASYYDRVESRVVMGNVPYPGGDGLSADTLDIHYNYYVVATVPIGDVDFAPSREALMFTAHTNRTIEGITRDFKRNLATAIQREIGNAPTMFDAVAIMTKFQGVARGGSVGSIQYTWRGQNIPLSITPPTQSRQVPDPYNPGKMRTEQIKVGRIFVSEVSARSYAKHSKLPALDIGLAAESIFVTGYDAASFTATHKKKLLQWREKQPEQISRPIPATAQNLPMPTATVLTEDNPVLKAKRFILVDFPLTSAAAVIHPALVVSWTTIQAEKLPSRSKVGSTGRITGSYDVGLGKGNAPQPVRPGAYQRRGQVGVPGANIDTTKPVFWLHGNFQTFQQGWMALLDEFHTDYTVVCLPENRVAKFCRENPKYHSVKDECQAQYDKLAKNLTDAQSLCVWMRDNREWDTYNRLAPYARKITDPEVVKFIKASQANVETFMTARRPFRYLVSEHLAVIDAESPLDKYALFDSVVLPEAADELIRYLNNEYAFHTKGTQ